MMNEKWLRVRTNHGEVAHMAKQMYGGGWRTLCGRNVKRMHTEPNWSLCFPCSRRAKEQGIEAKR